MSGEGLRAIDLSGKDWEALPLWASESPLPEILAAFLPSRRWFGSKSRTIRKIRPEAVLPLDGGVRGTIFLCLLRVVFEAGEDELYFLPLVRAVRGEVPEAGEIARLDPADGNDALLADGFFVAETGRGLLREILSPDSSRSGLERVRTEILEKRGVTFDPSLVPTVFGGEQSNTSLLFGRRLMLKGFRRLSPGMNPDLEVGEFLARQGEDVPIPATFGALLAKTKEGDPLVLALLQEFVENQGDGWSWFLARLPAVLAGKSDGQSLDRMVKRLGTETARLHRALGRDPADPDFAPRPFGEEDLTRLSDEIEERLGRLNGTLEEVLPRLPPSARTRAGVLLSRREDLGRFLSDCRARGAGGMRLRCHGDLHLGQVLVTSPEGVVFLDFEGEPALPLARRRLRTTPLQDVAGMLRSFHYLSMSALPPGPEGRERAEEWHRGQVRRYLRAYGAEMSTTPGLLPDSVRVGGILGLCLLRKALYELLYEIDNRPGWLEIPLSGILSLLEGPLPEFGGEE